MKNRCWIAVALTLAGCAGNQVTSVVSPRVVLAPKQPLDQGGALGRHGYGKITEKELMSPHDLTSHIYGYDISYYQGNVDFTKLAPAADFVVMRASYGNNSVDSKFATYRAAAEAQGMEIGFYHYSYPNLNGAADEAGATTAKASRSARQTFNIQEPPDGYGFAGTMRYSVNKFRSS